MRRYNPKEIETKWQKIWAESGIYKTDINRPADKFYVIPMLPYPSGDLHIGHWYNFGPTDTVARFHRMLGQNVFTTLGFDAFGLPAENAAIKNTVQPAKWTYGNIESMKKQIAQIGASYDWDHTLITCQPDYYRWNQWMFLKLYEKGLAYRAKAEVNWDPVEKTVLANEQVIDGRGERSGALVERKELEQWFYKITDYADRLLDGLETVEWPAKVKTMQTNWIGKSQGALIDFKVDQKIDYVLLHGYTGSSTKNFFPWVSKELRKDGHGVYVPDLPNTEKPDAKEQADFVLKNHSFTNQTVLLGHSYGSVSALRIVEQLERPIKKLVLVAGFVQPGLKDRKRNWEETTDWEFDFEKIKNNAREIVILRCENDYAVPAERADFLQEKLGGRIVDFMAEEEHVTGLIEPVVQDNLTETIQVFTTRPDTIFGATYMVLAPEHPLVRQIVSDECKPRVEQYVKETSHKTELERKEAEKHKTGTFTGAYAINPATKKKIPIWIADYVLSTYGTGAIMAVPAHDKRDGEFAQKFDLPIQPVIEPLYIQTADAGKVKPDLPFKERQAITAIVKHWSEDKYLGLKWKKVDWDTFITGGVEDGQTPAEAAMAEISEETGYQNLKLVKELDKTHAQFFHVPKNENRFAHFSGFYFELEDGAKKGIAEGEKANHTIVWLSPSEMDGFRLPDSHRYLWNQLRSDSSIYDGEGIMCNSGKYNGLDSATARDKIVADLAKEGMAKEQINYRLRDWLISRQRYWGTPIPIIYCDKCGVRPVPEKDLPVILPEDVEFTPAGRNPLLDRPDFVDTKCPNCAGDAKRETDTMDTFVDSSWYFLRYIDNKNDKEPFSVELINKWAPVDHYIGGIEHAILHLLYARFVTKFLRDEHGLAFEEPFKKLTNQGIILGPDGQKMSKSRGNVVNPDEQVNSYGADSLRLYLMFMGPYDQGGPYDMSGIAGTRRFLDRLWTLLGEFLEAKGDKNTKDLEITALAHKSIKKVTKDLERLDFNTAIAAMMSLVNDLYKIKAEEPVTHSAGWRFALETLTQLLAPFAPHITEEIWENLGHAGSVHVSSWPRWDENLVAEEVMTLAVQINGKVRSEIVVEVDISEAEAIKVAKQDVKITPLLKDKTIKKEIYVPGRLVSLVI